MTTEPTHVSLLRAGDEFQAQTIAMALREIGIDAVVIPRAANDALPGIARQDAADGVTILVPRHQVEISRRFLQQQASELQNLNWDEVDVGEREDRTPLHPHGRTPLLARLGGAVGLIIVALVVLLALMAILLLPWR